MAYVSHLMSSPFKVKFAPSFQDRAPPIISKDELQAARDICPHRMNGCKILEINRSTILKVGYNATLGEAEAICLVKRSTSVPVPRVLNAYMIDDIGFILMERIPGSTLERDLENLASDSLKDIATQLREYIHQWRKIEGSFVGGVDSSPRGRHIQTFMGKCTASLWAFLNTR